MSFQQNTKPQMVAIMSVLLGSSFLLWSHSKMKSDRKKHDIPPEIQSDSNNNQSMTMKTSIDKADGTDLKVDLSVLSCIRNRRSVFPNGYLKNPPPLDDSIIQSLIDAALWGPFHGKKYKDCKHPAKFVVLGKQSMVEMQNLTLQFYDKHWEEVGWGCSSTCGDARTKEAYKKWRKQTQDEITGRWGPCSHMIAIIMRRQSGPKRLPEWEEAAAVAAATQNIHIQSTKFPQLACYWSSWHDAARDSDSMKDFLDMDAEDKCMGFFIVAQRDPKRGGGKDRRVRNRSLLEVEWRH